MEFKEFANLLMPIIGGSSNTHRFCRSLFESIMNDDGPQYLAGISESSFKAYYNGHSSISRIAPTVLAHLENENFVAYLDDFGDETSELLIKAFEPHIADIDKFYASTKIAELFVEILHTAASKKKSTPKSAKKDESKSASQRLNDKILASGQALANAWNNAIENLADELDNNSSSNIELPENQSSAESPYSSEDNNLLDDFSSDYV